MINLNLNLVYYCNLLTLHSKTSAEFRLMIDVLTPCILTENSQSSISIRIMGVSQSKLLKSALVIGDSVAQQKRVYSRNPVRESFDVPTFFEQKAYCITLSSLVTSMYTSSEFRLIDVFNYYYLASCKVSAVHI